ncbi:MAG: gliding motility-associated C-terminal domain-containing protein [Bacteroidales bacterium]|nr:gliding motility-associated C-terminal domain-containing protein [Bacteroidales bacterium]
MIRRIATLFTVLAIVAAASQQAGAARMLAGDGSLKTLDNLPNVFTPNNDGTNDYFEFASTGNPLFVLRVFSRTGAFIYREEAQTIKWNGCNAQGNRLPNGIYYYIIEDLNGEYETAKGFVYIYGDMP